MKMKVNLFLKAMVAALPLLWGCGDDDDSADDPATPASTASVTLKSQSISEGEEIDAATTQLSLTYSVSVRVATTSGITLNGTAADAVRNPQDVTGVLVTLNLEEGTDYTLTIPAGCIVANSDATALAPAFTLNFKTKAKAQPVNPSVATTPVAATDAPALKLYQYLIDNYQQKVITGMMADVNWNNKESEKVYQMVGRYPAINGYDYLHLPYSGSGSWINYGDITPVKTWYENNGIVTIGWHWNVPSTEGGTDYGFYKGTNSANGETTFKIANAVTEGTWENRVVKADMETIAQHLKLLKDAGIPVLWRPLHEASGGWFWWGAGTADQCKKLWVMMFDYFKEQGLTNLLWVWTDDKKDWYPGDAYVDIVGCDIYGDTAAECVAKYNTMQSDYSTKMVALTECGYSNYVNRLVPTIDEQWEAGATWAYFMPWYSAETHAPAAWWNAIKNSTLVIWRDDVPSMK